MDKKTVDMLTTDSVSLLTQQPSDGGGVTYTLGNHRRAYVNSTGGREALAAEQPEDVVAAVMAIWGDTPTVTDTLDGQ